MAEKCALLHGGGQQGRKKRQSPPAAQLTKSNEFATICHRGYHINVGGWSLPFKGGDTYAFDDYIDIAKANASTDRKMQKPPLWQVTVSNSLVTKMQQG